MLMAKGIWRLRCAFSVVRVAVASVPEFVFFATGVSINRSVGAPERQFAELLI
jgi:hypothetical protein